MTGEAPRFGYLWEMRPYFRQVAGQLVLGSIAGIIMNTAVVLPAIYLFTPAQAKEQTKTDRAAAAKTFGVVVEVPGRPGHYCAAVDKAMDLKLKRERSTARGQ